jgi:hypothetical protein
MSVFDSKETDFVFLYNSSDDDVLIYAGNETAVPPKSAGPSILIHFKTRIGVIALGKISSKSCIKIKMTQDAYGFMETINMADFYQAYKTRTPREVFKQIQPRYTDNYKCVQVV